MARPVPWNESFDRAFLGTVTETEVLASGFGGVVRAGYVSEYQVASKEMHRDDDDEELFKEIYVGLLVPASPCMGFAVTEGGAPRLISARLPENVAEFLARSGWEFETCLQLAIGMLESVEHLAHLGLVHCDIKPNNFMLDDQRNVFIIDFGSISVEGDVPPMTCQQYCPPDSVVTLAWDVFSLGVVFSEMFRLDPVQAAHIAQQNPAFHGGLERLISRMCSCLISDRPSLRECSFVLRAAFEKRCL
jgi:predicted Ser/Thr protein kinase